jgi:hypothetical protein
MEYLNYYIIYIIVFITTFVGFIIDNRRFPGKAYPTPTWLILLCSFAWPLAGSIAFVVMFYLAITGIYHTKFRKLRNFIEGRDLMQK